MLLAYQLTRYATKPILNIFDEKSIIHGAHFQSKIFKRVNLTCIYRGLLGFKYTLILLGLIIIQVHHAFTETDH